MGFGLSTRVFNCIPRKQAYRTPCPAEAWIQAWNDSAEAGKILPSFTIVVRHDHAVPHCPRRPKAMVCGVGVFGQRKSLPKPQAPFHRCRSHCRRSSMSILIWDAKTHVNVSTGEGVPACFADKQGCRPRQASRSSVASSVPGFVRSAAFDTRPASRHSATLAAQTHSATFDACCLVRTGCTAD